MCKGNTSLDNDKKLNRTHKKVDTNWKKIIKRNKKITLRMS